MVGKITVNKKIILSIIFAVIIIIGGTFAWYSWSSSSNTNVSVTIEDNVVVTYSGGPDITTANLIPVASKTNNEHAIQKTITTKATATGSTIDLYLETTTIPSGLKDTSFKWELYNNTTSVTVGSGNFASATAGGIIRLTPSSQNVLTTVTNYTLYIWLDGTMDNSLNVLGKTFTFKLYATGSKSTLRESGVEASSSPVTLTNTTGNDLTNYVIKGNSVQGPNPSPSSPQAVTSLGENGSITATSSGKNLFNRSTAIINSAYTWDRGVLFSENNSLASDFIKVEEGQSYITNYNTQVMLYDSNKTFIKNYNGQQSGINQFTISGTNIASYVRLGYRTSYNSGINMTNLTNIQVEVGSVATNYEPYQTPITTTINLSEPLRCIGTICDEIDYANGQILRKITVKNIITSTFYSSYSSSTQNIFRSDFSSNFGYNTGYINALMTHLKSKSSVWSANSENNTFTLQDANSNGRAILWMNVSPNDYANLTAFNAWLDRLNTSGYPVKLYYPLYTPVPEHLSLPKIKTVDGTTILSVSDGTLSASNISASY